MSLFISPPMVEGIRRRLFTLEDGEVYLSFDDYKTYWPFVSNIWSANGNPQTVDDCTTSYWRCRLFSNKEWVPPDENHPRQRHKPSRKPVSCGMRMRVIAKGVQAKFKRTGKCVQHSHSLEDIDRSKRPAAILDLAAKQVANGYKVVDVMRSFGGRDCEKDQNALYSVGGKFLSRRDVHNASKAWKKKYLEHLESKSPGSLKGKVIVLVGGASGIGAATVQLLNVVGAFVIFGDCDDTSGQNLVLSLNSEHVHFLKTDVTNYEDNIALFKLALVTYGKVDHAMAIVGITEQGKWFDPSLTVESVEKLPPTTSLNAKLHGVLCFARIASVYLRQNLQTQDEDKSLLLLSSIPGGQASPDWAAYHAAQDGILGLMRSLRSYLPDATGIRVNAICPWMTITHLSIGIEEIWSTARFLNQPVDVAKVCIDVIRSPSVHGKAFHFGGGRASEMEESTTRLKSGWSSMGQDSVPKGLESLGKGDWTGSIEDETSQED